MLTKRKGESYKSAPCEVYIEEKRYKIKKRQKKKSLAIVFRVKVREK